MERILILGGNGAGLTAAARAKRLKRSLQVTVVEQGPHVAYSQCGVPYWISGIVGRAEDLVFFSPEEFQALRGITVLTLTRAVEILPGQKRVRVERVEDGAVQHLPYDKLVIATGYSAILPDIPGTDAEGVFTLVNLEDGARIHRFLSGENRRRAVILGGGYIGLEMAESLRTRGLEVTVLEKGAALMGSLDEDMSAFIEQEMERQEVRVIKNASVTGLRGDRENRVTGVVLGSALSTIPADLVMTDIGVKPNADLAAQAGIALGSTGAIAVNERMESSVPSVYAAGNCAESYHIVAERYVLDALGTSAAKQGRVVGDNLAGRRARFAGVVGTAVVKVFDLTVACTGLSTAEAKRLGFRVASARITERNITSYYPGSRPLTVKVILDRNSRRLLGAQMIGGPDAAKRIDILATALTNKMRIDEVAQLDLSYAPPYAPLWDPILIACQAGLRELE